MGNEKIDRKVQEVYNNKDKKIGAGELNIVGGKFSAAKLVDFLELPCWAGLEYRIWEQVDAMLFDTEHTMPGNIDLLEYGRLFAASGDLMLRRDGDAVLWRFIGDTANDIKSKMQDFNGKDFWASNQDARLTAEDAKMLLWGSAAKTDEEGIYWADDRTACQKLRYPCPGAVDGSKALVKYINYINDSKLQFVRFTGLEVRNG